MIKLSSLIKIDNPSAYKLHAARWSKETQPLDAFVSDKEEWRDWNRYRYPKNEFNREFIFSLMDFYHETNTWLFGGIFKVTGRRKESGPHGYEIEEIEEYKELVGRLKILMKKPSRGRAFKLEKHYEEMQIGEILKDVYSGRRFPGYENTNLSFGELVEVVKSEKTDWKNLLEAINGVYCIYDKKTGKKYVGSAYGEMGIWGRWACYCQTGHGGNVILQELIGEFTYKYAMENFQVSLLEVIPFSKDEKYTVQREQHWKNVMLSVGEFGYNTK